MTFRRLLLRNLAFFWRTNLAVICGVAAATAVIGGALIVGDSVRDSLRQMSLQRLGGIDHAVHGLRFFREELADALSQSAEEVKAAAPLLMLQGTLERTGSGESVSRIGQVHLQGLNARAWKLLDTGDLLPPEPGEIVLNRSVADQLQAKTGDPVSLVLEIPPTIPRDSLLGERNETLTELSLTVSAIAEDSLGISRFGLNPSQQLPANAFVSLSELQAAVGLAAVPGTPRNPSAKPARVNALFIGMDPQGAPSEALSRDTAGKLTSALKIRLTLEDLSLRIVENQAHGYLSLESEQMFLEDSIAAAALETSASLGVNSSPVLVYLVNQIWSPESPQRYSMYSVIAGIDPGDEGPFGPFEFVGDHAPLTDQAVFLNEWVAEDLGAATGKTVRVSYHVVGDRGELPEAEHDFTVAGIVRLSGPAADPGYTPHVPGVTDAASYADWREPFPLKRDRITSRDDSYWEDHRTTPKIFVSLATAQNLWRSRYGNLTSLRLAPRSGQSLDELKGEFTAQFLNRLNPERLGLAVQPVKRIGLDASRGSTDFTQLFLGFSFFLILSAALLVGLLFRLGIERRTSEVGLLLALGLSPRQVRRLLLSEGTLLVTAGGLLGLPAAVGYAGLMIHGLKTWWFGAIGTKFLFLSVQPVSLMTGFVISAAVAVGAVWWALRQTRGREVRQLLMGGGETLTGHPATKTAPALAAGGLGGSGLLLALTLFGVIPDQEAFFGFSWRVVVFFVVGMGLLAGSLAWLATLLGSRERLSVRGRGTVAEVRFSARNASRNQTRSVLTAGLIACATFLIVAVGAGQQNPTRETPNPRSGNGGFTLVAETNVPVLYDLNTPTGRNKLGLPIVETAGSDPLVLKQIAALESARVFPFRVRPGENASCLNLYQTQLPTILGVPSDVLEVLDREQRFLFANTPGDHPWRILQEELPGGHIPVFGDMNTLLYSLHKPVGQTIAVPEEQSPEHLLEVRGMLANSVFQGVLLMSEGNFRRLFPEQAGFRYFLIDVDPTRADDVALLLESHLGDYGLDAERVSHRLANFLSVQNTYLSTFQTLGGLGLLLGTLGMAVVMLRNVIERRSEFALLQAVGFRSSQIARLVIWENSLLLSAGLASGTLSALLAMAPHLLGSSADVPWLPLAATLMGVVVIGLTASVAAVRAAVGTPILSTLRGE